MSDGSKSYHDQQWAIYKERILKLLRGYTPDLRNTTGVLPGRQLPTGGPSGTGYPAAPHATAWADVTGTPTTLAGYGITDALNSVTARAANTVLAGPSSGADAAGAFRALVAADIPSLPWSKLTSGLPTTLAGYGIADAYTKTASDGRYAPIAVVGSVTSVGITPPAAGIGVSGSPITGSGSITLALANDLLALEGLGSTGLAVRSAADTWVQRTIAGTSNRLTVTNGDGVSGNPTLDISTSFVGQTAITTLGTIGTGVWQATKIGLAYGGTNADLSATGGANQIVRQNSAGGAFTVSVLAAGDLPATAVTAASYGSATQSPTFTVDAAGRLTLAANATIAPAYTSLTYSGLTTGQSLRATSATAAAFGALDLTNASAITGALLIANGGTGAATASANLAFAGPTSGGAAAPTFRALVAADLPNTAVTPGTYGTSTTIGSFTVDAQGRITGASTISPGILAGAYTGDFALTGALATTGSIGVGEAVNSATRLHIKGADATSSNYSLIATNSSGTASLIVRNDNALGFFGATEITRPTVSGSRGGNAALASLCTALANLGLITNSSS